MRRPYRRCGLPLAEQTWDDPRSSHRKFRIWEATRLSPSSPSPLSLSLSFRHNKIPVGLFRKQILIRLVGAPKKIHREFAYVDDENFTIQSSVILVRVQWILKNGWCGKYRKYILNEPQIYSDFRSSRNSETYQLQWASTTTWINRYCLQ